eukprot:TRINITY_DN2570_c0_g1_i1.p1 TRINITY_DN2570_c0_g1~~TRINITY_DN2570_c0_g1_i1.p1  ORF type:complete len:325 (+),score=22.14 TRINITY_DN2570_c0_g1_i1:67-1041(+)
MQSQLFRKLTICVCVLLQLSTTQAEPVNTINCGSNTCSEGEVCVNETCTPVTSTTCGRQNCSIDESCYRYSTGAYCVPNCNGWLCSENEVCKDFSSIGITPVCVPDRSCGGQNCSVGETCYRDSTGTRCVANCNKWMCSASEVCQDRSSTGMLPRCVPDTSTTCGRQNCSIDESCYRYSTGAYCVPNCNGWLCSENEVCKDLSSIGISPVCVPNRSCGGQNCSVGETCYRDSTGTRCVANCNKWMCPDGEVCQDRSPKGELPLCIPDHSATCGGLTCTTAQTCYRYSTGSGYCVANCNRWLCPDGQRCQDRSSTGIWPVCVPGN